MMLARVADSLYWIGRYVERAEHLCRVSDVMLLATLDRTDAATQVANIGMAAVSETRTGPPPSALDAAEALAFDREDPGSIVSALARARENARQVRDQITTETWERLNMVYLRLTGPGPRKAFHDQPNAFLQGVIADLHLFKGAADATMSHGEGWRFLLLGVYLERSQLIGRLLEVCFADPRHRNLDHFALTSVLRMACALEPYLRVYTADIRPRAILEFLLLDPEFPRSLRFCTSEVEAHLARISRIVETASPTGPDRFAGRLKARLQYVDIDEIARDGALAFLDTVLSECAEIHRAVYESFVAYPLEHRLPA